MTFQRMTCAQALVRFLEAQYLEVDGVEEKFVGGAAGVFGHGSVLGLGEALAQPHCQIPFYRVQNEQGAGHMAIGYAKQHRRRKILVCLSSVGPGAMNLVTAAATASVNRIPVLFLPGDVFANRQPDPVLQQVEQEYDLSLGSNDAFRAVSKYWDRIHRPEQLMSAAIQAMRVLTDPAYCGAVTLSLPQDVAAEAFDYPSTFFERRVHRLERRPLSPGAADRMVALLARARRPLLLLGGGVRYSDAAAELRALVETCGIPFAETQAGKGEIEWNHPLNLGGIGTTGTLAANRVAKNCDCLIAVGTRLNDFHTASKWLYSAPGLSVIGINVNRMDAYKLDGECFQADAQLALAELLPKLQQVGYQSQYHPGEIAAIKKEWDTEVERLYAAPSSQAGRLQQTRVLSLLQQSIPAEAVVVSAGGSLPSDLERIWRPTKPGSYHLEYGYSCMGYEIPGAIGVKLAEPQREVWVVLGDGGYLLYHQELVTAVAEGIKINVLLFDNHGWQCIDNLQTSQGIRHFGCELRYRNPATGQLDGDYLPIDFAANAASYGCEVWKASSEHELLAAIAAARASSKPSLVEVKCVVKSMTGGYESWWNAGTPEVSSCKAVQQAYEQMSRQRKLARAY